MSDAASIRARFQFHPEDSGHPTPAAVDRRIRRGAIVEALAAQGQPDRPTYLVSDVDEEAGLAYLNYSVAATGTYAAEEDRVARIDDLRLVRPARSARQDRDANHCAAQRQRMIPAKVLAACEIVSHWLTYPDD